MGCQEEKDPKLNEGMWLAELEVMNNEVLPFIMTLKNSDGHYTMDLHNADEVIEIDEIEIDKDSIIIRMPVYEGYIAGTFSDNEIHGSFIKESLDRVVPFSARFGEKERFKIEDTPAVNISGIWEVLFSPETEDTYIAKGIFTQQGSNVTGTFRTTTGDYRYLEGVVDGSMLKLSTFDGAHAFLFTADVADSIFKGTFYSGNHFKEPFTGKRNAQYELPNEDSLTYIKEGEGPFTFSFPDTEGKTVSLADDRFEDKVTIVQIMGTWCPNCLDETKFLVNYLNENGDKDLEIVGLAFEYAKTKEKAINSIRRLKNRINVEYPILLAQFGTSNKLKANEKLPMLNHVLSYPTTIFIDKKGEVRKIHTGFNGPATGDKYISFKNEFSSFVDALLEE